MKTNNRIARYLSILALAAVLIGGARTAAADSTTAKCTLVEIEANNGPGGIDADLKGLAKKLKRPPFASWKTFTLLARTVKTLEVNKAQEEKLKKGGKIELLLLEVTAPAGGKGRWSMNITADAADGKRVVDTKSNAAPSDYIVIGYALPDNTGHIMAITCDL